MKPSPKKLKKDAIAEALLEVQFVTSDLPELVIGKLADGSYWRDFLAERLPFADIPIQLREIDQKIKYMPFIEKRSAEKTEAVKIGPSAISFHALKPYPGWSKFGILLHEGIDFLFGTLKDFEATRLGFRYVNIFTSADHAIEQVFDLDFKLEVSGKPLIAPLNLNYRNAHGSDHLAIIKLASSDFVTPATPGLCALVDIDVSTPTTFKTKDSGVAHEWLERAHVVLKDEFFALFTDQMFSRLSEN